jgi:3-polyprenyl-4-hydroxybenzoate decarboxylase
MSNRETIEDLRSWLTWLEEEEHLAHVTERVHWDQELSGIVRRTYDIYGDASPAMLFENIEDYEAPKPNKLFIGQFRSYSRICMMLGLDPVESTRRDIGLVIKERLNTLVPPVTATEAPGHQRPQIPGPLFSRPGRRALCGHHARRHHQGSRQRLGQSRHVPGDGARA